MTGPFNSLSRIVTAYGLTLAGFLMLSGRVGDIYGHKNLFIIGVLHIYYLLLELQEGGAYIAPIFLPNELVHVWLMSLTVTILAGLFPAWKASRLSPLIAMRV